MDESFSLRGAAAAGRERPMGEIHLIVGPMFAGKTTALLRRITSEADLGNNVAMVKSSKDTRYATDAVVTHDGMRFPCWDLPDLSSFKCRIGSDAYGKVDVIGIDEAQFFNDLYGFCCHAADIDRKIVIVAGLDGDFLRNSFGSILRLVPHADSIVKLTARCEVLLQESVFYPEKDSNEANRTDWRFRHLHAGLPRTLPSTTTRYGESGGPREADHLDECIAY